MLEAFVVPDIEPKWDIHKEGYLSHINSPDYRIVKFMWPKDQIIKKLVNWKQTSNYKEIPMLSVLFLKLSVLRNHSYV